MGRSITSRRGPLPAPEVFANDSTLTQFSGIMPLARYLVEELDLVRRLSQVVGTDGVKRVYGRHLVLFSFLMGSLAGVHRLSHLEWLRGDAVLLKFLRLPRWPVRKVFSAALAGLSDSGVERLVALIAQLGLAGLSGRDCAVVDLDSSSIVSFGRQEGAYFGYSGKGRNRRRHHPLVASVGETRTVIHADYRDGSSITADEAIAFLKKSVSVLRAGLAPGARVSVRSDSGFWSKSMGSWLLEEQLPFIFSLPLYPWVKLILRNTRWRAIDGEPDIQVTTIQGERLGLDERLRVVGIRRRVLDSKTPPQGKVIAGCQHWRYQSLVTGMAGEPEDLWRFYNGRADCEQVFRVARQALGMSKLIGHALRANETAFLLRLLAFNADQRFQADALERADQEHRPSLKIGLVTRQRRFYQGAGRLLRCRGRWVMRVRQNAMVERMWRFYATQLIGTG